MRAYIHPFIHGGHAGSWHAGAATCFSQGPDGPAPSWWERGKRKPRPFGLLASLDVSSEGTWFVGCLKGKPKGTPNPFWGVSLKKKGTPTRAQCIWFGLLEREPTGHPVGSAFGRALATSIGKTSLFVSGLHGQAVRVQQTLAIDMFRVRDGGWTDSQSSHRVEGHVYSSGDIDSQTEHDQLADWLT